MAAPWGQAGSGRHWPGWRAMTGDREVGEWQGRGRTVRGRRPQWSKPPARVWLPASPAQASSRVVGEHF